MTGRLLFIIVAVVSFAIDRVTKVIVQREMQLGERVEVLGDLLALRYVQNRGIAFGLFSDAGMLVVVGSVIVGLLLFVFMLHVDPDDLLTVLGGALITGGALGNLVDRVQLGYVVDFLQLPSWPTFNVADVSITAGVICVLLAQLVAVRRESRMAVGEEREE